MTPEKQTPAAPSAARDEADARPAHRDLQRAALRDLVSLSAECAAAESRIDEEFRAAVEQGEKEYENAKWVIEERHKRQADAIRQKYGERVARAEDKYQSELNALRAADGERRRRAEHDFGNIDQDVKQKYKQAVWLADSVFDVAQNTARVEAKQRRDQVAADLEALDGMDKRAGELLALYKIPGSVGVSHSPGPAAEGGGGGLESTDPDAAFAAHRAAAERHLARLQSLKLPRLFVGMLPYILLLLACALAAAAAQWRTGSLTPDVKSISIAGGATLVALVVLGVFVRIVARNQVRDAHGPLRGEIEGARAAAAERRKRIEQVEQERHVEAVNARKAEVQSARDKFSPILSRATQARDAAVASAKAEFDEHLARVEQERNEAVAKADESLGRHVAEADERRAGDLEAAGQKHESHLAEARRRHDQRRAELERHWTQGLARIQAPISQNGNGENGAQSPPDWETGDWQHWTPPRHFADAVRFGELAVDLPQITDQIPRKLRLPPSFSVPASLSFPAHSSLLIHTDHEGRAEAIRILQMVMARLLTSLPAGRVHFTIIDPVGLGQNFAGFMHLADHDEALVGGRIWTESDHIEQRLANLTEHMETVIQKYLRNEFETIDDYNAQAGELAEPYRFLVIADFPVGFEGDSFRRLASIASTGARCGVYTLVVRDTRVPLPSGAHMDELEAHSLNLVRKGGRFVWRDEVFQRFPLTLDPPPSEQSLTRILDLVGRHAREAKRVEVPFETIAPDPAHFWTRSSDNDVTVPIGRLGATRLQNLRLGRGVAQHALIAGKTGSGKSTLLHALVTNLAMWYSPNEVEFYLVDFKKGVEFKTYATHQLPHARAIAVESDREFGLSVLHRLDAELAGRGELFRKLGVQDLASYREIARSSSSSVTANPLPPLPRTLLIIDEFQEFFSEDDKLAQDASVLLDRLVRQGRAFGIHVLLGSQTIGGTSGLSRSTLGQMAVRIALQTSEADSQLILGDGNSAARLLTRPGEAIYNDQGGLVEANSPFQVAWLPDEQREVFLQRVQELAAKRTVHAPAAIVFEGNAPADITKNQRLSALIDAPNYPTPAPLASAGWLGEPVAIKDPTAILLRRQSGANAIIIGQQEELAMAMMASSVISLAAQHAAGAARFVVLDGTAADSPLAAVFSRVKAAIPHEVKLVEYRAVPEAMNELAEELARRQASADNNPPAVFVLVYGLQRYRALRKTEESFSFGGGDEEKKPAPDKQFADLLREGPPLGIHTLAWADTAASLERTLDRNSMREFDNRILFQMSAADSSNLIDSPAANKLGMNRALAYSEEQGTTEKFRPYGLPTGDYLDHVRTRFGEKAEA